MIWIKISEKIQSLRVYLATSHKIWHKAELDHECGEYKMPIKKEKQEALHQRMEELGIYEDDLLEKFILGSGKGGQKVNKSATCVYLKHLPSKLEVKCQQERSRELNRYYARQKLCELVASEIESEKTAKQQKIEKIRRQKRKRTKRAKEKMLASKKKRSTLKSQRASPTEEDV